MSVQQNLIGQGFDRDLTESGHGQKLLDSGRTNFVFSAMLDKVWTVIGRTLDKARIFYPMSVQPQKGKEHPKLSVPDN